VRPLVEASAAVEQLNFPVKVACLLTVHAHTGWNIRASEKIVFCRYLWTGLHEVKFEDGAGDIASLTGQWRDDRNNVLALIHFFTEIRRVT
jgi:hypothetical protein